MAEQAWNDLVARIGYTARTRDYLHSAAGINIPSTLVEATTLPGFDKFIDGLDKKASAFKLLLMLSGNSNGLTRLSGLR